MKKYLLVSLAFILPFLCGAQSDVGLQFMDIAQSNSTNPAKFNADKYTISLPSLSYGFYNSAFTINDIIEIEGTVMNVDFTQAIANMDETGNLLSMHGQLDVLGVAFQIKNFQLSLNYGVKVNQNMLYPKGLFKFIWEGNSAVDAEVLELGPELNFNAYHELGIGGAYKVNDNLSVGARLKFLGGVAAVSTESSQLRLLTDQNNYTLTASTDYSLYSSGIVYEDGGEFSLSDMAFEKAFGKNGGVGFDFGATYKTLNDKLVLQASIVDLGSINWNTDISKTSTVGEYEIVVSDALPIFENEEGTSAIDTLKEIFNFQTVDQTGSFKTKLGAKTFVSAIFTPVKGLNLGALVYGEQFQSKYLPTMALNVNKQFGSILNLGMTYSAKKNSANNIGASISAKLLGVQLYALTDNIIPMFNVKAANNFNVRMGINVAFGKSKKIVEAAELE